MRVHANLAWQVAFYDGADAGEGLAIFLSQQNGSITRYHCIVKAVTDQGNLVVGEFFTSPPNATTPQGPPTRQVAFAVCPGAKSWSVEIQNSARASGSHAGPQDTAEIVLTSSKCCTGPAGLNRVGERWTYRAGVDGSYTVAPGQNIKSLSAISGATPGSVQFGSGATITVPIGVSMQLEPTSQLLANTVITFTDVTWVIELLEGA